MILTYLYREPLLLRCYQNGENSWQIIFPCYFPPSRNLNLTNCCVNSTRILFDLNFDTFVRKEKLKLREIVTTVFVLNEINMKSNTTIQNLQGAGGGCP